MHIEPGFVSAAKLALANVAAAGLVASTFAAALAAPRVVAATSTTSALAPLSVHGRAAQLAVRTLIAALIFTACMQCGRLPVGPSELHLLGALPIYLTLGFAPALLGFAGGLLLQGLVFSPGDLAHLGVNTLTLAVPLTLLHAVVGSRLRSVDAVTLVKLDAAYYAGVTLMVGFWLAIGETATPLSAWAGFAAAYAAVAIAEPVISWLALRGVARFAGTAPARFCFDCRLAAA
jgi:cobalt/nickel transport system permease protein